MQRLEIPYHIIIVDSCEIGLLCLSLLDTDYTYTFIYKDEVQSPIICKY